MLGADRLKKEQFEHHEVYDEKRTRDYNTWSV